MSVDDGDASRPNTVLKDLRTQAGLSQHDLALALNRLAHSGPRNGNVTGKQVWRWESGATRRPHAHHLRLLADYFARPIDTLGFTSPHAPSANPAQRSTAGERPADSEQEHWRCVRSRLGAHRRALAIAAERYYHPWRVPGLTDSGAITHPDWLPDVPIPLDQLRLVLDSQAPAAAVTGAEPASAGVRPRRPAGPRYRRYHHAIRDLHAPTLFENRLCFRLLNMDWDAPEIALSFGQMGFFDAIDINETLAHETAQHLLPAHDGATGITRTLNADELPFRALVGDPFDLTRRPLMGAIGTLTIRGGDHPSMVLHHRDTSHVAGGGGMTHLLPAGIFQPSSVLPDAIDNDFSLWRNIQREYAEELLGHDEFDGSGGPIDYARTEPFASMDVAYAAGDIRVWCLGITLDALTLAGDILTVAVIAPATYDRLFAEAVDTNTEGAVPARRVPFNHTALQSLHRGGTLSPGAAAAIHLTWRHRSVLL